MRLSIQVVHCRSSSRKLANWGKLSLVELLLSASLPPPPPPPTPPPPAFILVKKEPIVLEEKPVISLPLTCVPSLRTPSPLNEHQCNTDRM